LGSETGDIDILASDSDPTQPRGSREPGAAGRRRNRGPPAGPSARAPLLPPAWPGAAAASQPLSNGRRTQLAVTQSDTTCRHPAITERTPPHHPAVIERTLPPIDAGTPPQT